MNGKMNGKILLFVVAVMICCSRIAFAAVPTTVIGTIDPATVYANSDLNISVNCTDADETDLFANFTWYNNNTPVITYDTQVSCTNNTICYTDELVTEVLVSGDIWFASAICYDGADYSAAWENSTNETVINIIPDNANTVQTLTPVLDTDEIWCNGGCSDTDTGYSGLFANFTWYKNGVAVHDYDTQVNVDWMLWGFAQTDKFVDEALVVGDNWTCSMICYDGIDYSADWVNSTEVIVESSFTQTNGSAIQTINATVGSPVIFAAEVNVSGSGTCNFTTITSDRLMAASDLWVQNSTSENVSIDSNETEWVAWTCDEDQDPYIVYWDMPAPTTNCSSDTAFIQDAGITSTLSAQYLKRNCTLTNPSSVTYSNVSAGTLGCLTSWACNATSQTVLSLASLADDIIVQGASDANITISKSGWNQNIYSNASASNITNQYFVEQLNATWGTAVALVGVNYSSAHFTACPTDIICSGLTGLFNFTASGTNTTNATGTGDVLTETPDANAIMDVNVSDYITENDTTVAVYLPWNITNNATIVLNNVVAPYSETNITCNDCDFVLNFTASGSNKVNVTFNITLNNSKNTTGVLTAFSETDNAIYSFSDTYHSRPTEMILRVDKNGNLSNRIYRCTDSDAANCDTSNSSYWELTSANSTDAYYTKYYSMSDVVLVNSYSSGSIMGGGGGTGGATPTPTPTINTTSNETSLGVVAGTAAVAPLTVDRIMNEITPERAMLLLIALLALAAVDSLFFSKGD